MDRDPWHPAKILFESAKWFAWVRCVYRMAVTGRRTMRKLCHPGSASSWLVRLVRPIGLVEFVMKHLRMLLHFGNQ